MSEVDASSEAGAAGEFRLKALPIFYTFLLAVGVLLLSGITVEAVEHVVHLPERPTMPWISYYYGHVAQLAYALLAIAWLRKRHPADYGLHLPRGKSYLGPAIFWGLAFGVLMTLVDYWPQLLTLTRPQDETLALTPLNIGGWLSFEGIFVGPSEEIPFRALLVTYLTCTLPGRVSWRGYSMNGAGIVVAAMFALAHSANFFLRPFAMALGQQIYAFVMGVFYAYWLEKSRSVLAPIIGHNLSDMSEQILVFAMVATFH